MGGPFSVEMQSWASRVCSGGSGGRRKKLPKEGAPLQNLESDPSHIISNCECEYQQGWAGNLNKQVKNEAAGESVPI